MSVYQIIRHLARSARDTRPDLRPDTRPDIRHNTHRDAHQLYGAIRPIAVTVAEKMPRPGSGMAGFARRHFGRTVLGLAMAFLVAGNAWAQSCAAWRAQELLPTDHGLCKSLSATVAKPGALPLNEYEDKLSQFFDNWCHRDATLGWVRDKFVRDTGPFTAARDTATTGAEWVGTYHGTHAPVVIWYSPEMIKWLETNRAEGAAKAPDTTPIPDGAMMVKEMYPAPASSCAQYDPAHLWPTSGAAIMVRDAQGSYDGWFWGWYGWPGGGWSNDWPASTSNAPPNMGFGQYCVNCHGSAHDMTFADLRNVENHPGRPEVFLSQDFFNNQYLGHGPQNASGLPVNPAAGTAGAISAVTSAAASATASSSSSSGPMASGDQAADQSPLGSDIHALRAHAEAIPEPIGIAGPGNSNADLRPILTAFAKQHASPFGYDLPAPQDMPSQTYDNVWMAASGPAPDHQFLTSDQCTGCHDAGSTGLQFDMTVPDPAGDRLLNMSPYATWRSSPMGLAGRDPIFFAQMASEVQSFHPDSSDLVQNTCFGCHGIMGQRQFQIDHALSTAGIARAGTGTTSSSNTGTGGGTVPVTGSDADCGNFHRDMVNAIPYPPDNPAAGHASYGALARDGISCMSCHQMVLGKDATAKFEKEPQNACVLERQAALNAKETGFARTFTGSFLVGDAKTLYGPFEKPKTHPMEFTLGITPKQGDAITTSEMCGTCHTVHLPVLQDGKQIGSVYEQTTYAEWAFSDFRTGWTVDGALPGGEGKMPLTCQNCHMPSADDKQKFRSKIASIQEYSNFPAASNTFDPKDIDLEPRDGFARHTLVGLNVFLVEMFKQFPDVMGIPTADPMLGSKGVDPLEYTQRAMVDQARSNTATIHIKNTRVANNTLQADVQIASLTGHKFPSGVGFRRAFVTFEVLDGNNNVIWASGRVNKAGVLVDARQQPIAGELWWDDNCQSRIEPLKRIHQPHYQTITEQDQVQIYQELVSTPPLDTATKFSCGHNVAPKGELTTSFLSICAEVKDNRLPPAGYLPLDQRIDIAHALGANDDLAEDAGFTATGDDPDYLKPTATGGDSLSYKVDLSKLGAKAASVRARLSYQATPPFYLQDRFCTAKGNDTERLAYLVDRLNLKDTAAENWAFSLVDTGIVKIPR